MFSILATAKVLRARLNVAHIKTRPTAISRVLPVKSMYSQTVLSNSTLKQYSQTVPSDCTLKLYPRTLKTVVDFNGHMHVFKSFITFWQT